MNDVLIITVHNLINNFRKLLKPFFINILNPNEENLHYSVSLLILFTTMSRIPTMGSSKKEQKNLPLQRSLENISMPQEPKPGLKRSFENLLQPPKPGLKRFNENQVQNGTLNKKRCTDSNKPPFTSTGKALTQNSVTSIKNGGFSEQAKRAVFRAPSNLTTVRESMPAISSLPSARSNVTAKRGKRPAWDLKGRIQDMEECFEKTQKQNLNMEQELQMCNQRIMSLESDNDKLHGDVETKSAESEEATNEIKRLREELKEKNTNLESKEKEVHKLTTTVESLHIQLDNLTNTVSSLTGLKIGLETQLNASHSLNEQLRQEIKQLSDRIKSFTDENLKLKEENELLESKIREGETERRKLHNIVQELKGNIRVYCRMRPPLQDELNSGLRVASVVPVSAKSLEVYQLPDVGINDSAGKNQPKHEFSFDHIFPPSSTQNEVFHEISQLVQSSLDGYNVCIFAYGQTGSGKTYTMEGPENMGDYNEDEMLGMIPRAVQQIFSQATSLESKGWKYRTEVSFLEVYNEKIHDLLSCPSVNNKCEIKKTGGKGIDNLVSNVTTTKATSAEQVFVLLRKAKVNRVVAATKCNDRSSRSHYIFQMKIVGENAITDEKCEGTLNLIDLAGSERVKESGSEGDRLQEAKYINKSLSNLGNVIMSLSQKADHIPYRNSKLTHLLMNSLGGNSKTLMFVNISPDSENISETINSLRFATKVNQCNIGTAQKRIK